MAHFIDKAALVAWAKETYLCENASMIRKVCYKQLVEHLDTLEVKEVDLEKEMDKFYGMYRKNGKTFSTEDNEECVDWKTDCNPNFEIAFARHFFELGLNTQHSSINIPNIDDILEKKGINPFSKEAKIFKESYYMAMEKLKEKKGK